MNVTHVITFDTTRERLRELLAEMLEMDPDTVDAEVPVSAFGVDSLSSFVLSEELERWTGVSLEHDARFSRQTLSEIAEHVMAAVAAATTAQKER